MARSPSVCGVILANEAAESVANLSYLEACIELLRARTEMVLVIAGANATIIAPTVYSRGASLVENPSPEQGIFGSLKVGLQEILSRGRDAGLVMVSDRPPVDAVLLGRLEAEFLDAVESGQWAVVAELESSRDYPFYADREMIEAFLRAPLTASKEEVERAHAERIRYVSFHEGTAIASSERSIPVL